MKQFYPDFEMRDIFIFVKYSQIYSNIYPIPRREVRSKDSAHMMKGGAAVSLLIFSKNISILKSNFYIPSTAWKDWRSV